MPVYVVPSNTPIVPPNNQNGLKTVNPQPYQGALSPLPNDCYYSSNQPPQKSKKSGWGKIIGGAMALGVVVYFGIVGHKICKIEKASQSIEKDMTKIFDKIFDIFNKELGNGKLKKPEFEFITTIKNDVAHWDHFDGKISLNRTALVNDIYAISKTSKDGKKMIEVFYNKDGTQRVVFSNSKKNFEKLREEIIKEAKYENVEVIKLTEDEKKLFFTQALAHELRHYFQDTVMVKSKEVGFEKYKQFLCNNKMLINENNFEKKCSGLTELAKQDGIFDNFVFKVNGKNYTISNMFENMKSVIKDRLKYARAHDNFLIEQDAEYYSNEFMKRNYHAFSDLKIRDEIAEAFKYHGSFVPDN